jgi:hypothetical protein
MFAFRENAYVRLTWLLYTEPNYFRYGHPEGQDTVRLFAVPGLSADTLAFTPYPASLVLAAEPGTRPTTHDAAIDRNRTQLLSVVRTWAAAFPDSSKPHAALASALEVNRRLDGERVEESALAAARHARGTATGAADSLTAATVEARVLLKLERFGEAAALARNVTAQVTVSDPILARQMAGLYAVNGRVEAAVRYLRVSAPYAARRARLTSLALAVHEAREALLAYAAFGGPADSVRALARRLDTLIAIHEGGEPGVGFGCQFRWAPLSMAFPVLRRTTVDDECWRGVRWLEVQDAHEAGDTARAIAALDGLAASRSSRPGDVATLDGYLEAWTRIELGDTTGALARLDQTLTSIPVLRNDLLPEVAQVTGLVRVMALRARLAAVSEDSAVASRWARAVVDLWNESDEALQPDVDRMRAILGLPRRDPG